MLFNPMLFLFAKRQDKDNELSTSELLTTSMIGSSLGSASAATGAAFSGLLVKRKLEKIPGKIAGEIPGKIPAPGEVSPAIKKFVQTENNKLDKRLKSIESDMASISESTKIIPGLLTCLSKSTEAEQKTCIEALSKKTSK